MDKWDVVADDFKQEEIRPEFRGKFVLNPTTGQKEIVFPASERRKRYMVTWPIVALLVILIELIIIIIIIITVRCEF